VAHGVVYLAVSATRAGDLAHAVGGAVAFGVCDWKRVTEWKYTVAKRLLVAMRCIARYTQWRRDAIAQVLAAASASAAAAAASASVSITASVAASASAASISAAALLTANLSANATVAVAAEAATCGPSWETPWARVSYATIPDDDVSWWRTSYGAHATCMLECVVAEYLVWQLFKLERGTLIEETYLNLTLVFFVRCALTHVVTARELVLVAYSTATLAWPSFSPCSPCRGQSSTWVARFNDPH